MEEKYRQVQMIRKQQDCIEQNELDKKEVAKASREIMAEKIIELQKKEYYD